MTCAVTTAHQDVACWTWTCLRNDCSEHQHHDNPVEADAASAEHRLQHEAHGEYEPGTPSRPPVVSHQHLAPDECPRCDPGAAS